MPECQVYHVTHVDNLPALLAEDGLLADVDVLYRICRDQRDAVPDRYQDGEDPLVYLVSSVERIVTASASWLATDGNAAAALSHFTADADQLPTFIDWPLMRERYWADDNDDPDRVRRRMAELLVHRRCRSRRWPGSGSGPSSVNGRSGRYWTLGGVPATTLLSDPTGTTTWTERRERDDRGGPRQPAHG